MPVAGEQSGSGQVFDVEGVKTYGGQETSGNKDLEQAYALLRITLGLNICMHGVVRWVAGLSSFAESLVTMFQKIPLPVSLMYGFGFTLPVLESLVGCSVLLGFRTRRAFLVGMVVMLALSSTLHQDWQIAGLQLIYSFLYAVLLAGARFDKYGLDRFLPRSKAPLNSLAEACLPLP
jgi:thiosulfate dehydrogenase [quinone] large subunit